VSRSNVLLSRIVENQNSGFVIRSSEMMKPEFRISTIQLSETNANEFQCSVLNLVLYEPKVFWVTTRGAEARTDSTSTRY
jgi:hypothetical protein